MTRVVSTTHMKKIIITVVLGLIAAIAVGILYFKNLDTSLQGVSDSTMSETNSTSTTTPNENIKGKNSIMSLFQLGKSMECTFAFSSGGMRGEGTGFFNNGNGRIDSLYTSTSSAPTASYMITDAANKMMYTWTLDNGVAQGVKMAIPDETAGSEGAAPEAAPMTPPGGTGVTPETDVEYDCKPWVVDNSVFVPPSDVEFIDMTNMQKQMEEMKRSMGNMKIPGM
jgi:uncharacterized protein YxeA